MHKIRSYSHIAFHVKDMEAMKHFYCDQLGMKEKFTMTTDSNLEFAAWQETQGIVLTENAKKYFDKYSKLKRIPYLCSVKSNHRECRAEVHLMGLKGWEPVVAEDLESSHCQCKD